MITNILDTCVIINMFRGKGRIGAEVFESGVGVSSITLAELYYGAEKSRDKDRNLQTITEFIRDFEVEIYDFGEKESQIYGEMKAKLERLGNKLDDIDLMIAATALINQRTLVTENIKHFGRIKGLQLVET